MSSDSKSHLDLHEPSELKSMPFLPAAVGATSRHPIERPVHAGVQGLPAGALLLSKVPAVRLEQKQASLQEV